VKACVKSKLEELRSDYTQVVGQPFSHFYCPVLWKDEDVPLCQAHIVNRAFPNSSRAWTVQRRDVDSFYGSCFEADFCTIQYKNVSSGEILANKTLLRSFRPRILIDDELVDYYVPDGDIPEYHAPIIFDNEGQSVPLVLKMPPEEVTARVGQKGEIDTTKDVRVAALVSLIKAAYLSLFDMLGYRYALSPAGDLVGRQILGKFFRQNRNELKPDVVESALTFFHEFAHMVRPVQTCFLDLQGTITDKRLLVCRRSGGSSWAWIVFVRTSRLLHAVMMPIFDQPDAVATFLDFLQDENDSIEVYFCRLEQDGWVPEGEPFKLGWPKRDVLYP